MTVNEINNFYNNTNLQQNDQNDKIEIKKIKIKKDSNIKVKDP